MIRCYVTLCLQSKIVTAEEMGAVMSIPATRTVKAGQLAALKKVIERHGWFLTTLDMLESERLDDHINELFVALGNYEDAFEQLSRLGVDITLACFFQSDSGENPEISGESLSQLVKLNIGSFWIDCHKTMPEMED